MSFAAARPETRTLMFYDANKRSALLSYALWLFGGWFGLHRFYNGRPGSAFLLIALHIIGFVLTVVFIGYAILGIVWLWILIDALLIPAWVRGYNTRLAEMLDRGEVPGPFAR